MPIVTTRLARFRTRSRGPEMGRGSLIYRAEPRYRESANVTCTVPNHCDRVRDYVALHVALGASTGSGRLVSLHARDHRIRPQRDPPSGPVPYWRVLRVPSTSAIP